MRQAGKLSVQLTNVHLPKRDARTSSLPEHPRSTCDCTSNVPDDTVSYGSFASQLWALLPTLPTACVVVETSSSPFPTTPPLASDALPPPPASIVDSIINPTSVGNRINAVQTVLSSELDVPLLENRENEGPGVASVVLC